MKKKNQTTVVPAVAAVFAAHAQGNESFRSDIENIARLTCCQPSLLAAGINDLPACSGVNKNVQSFIEPALAQRPKIVTNARQAVEPQSLLLAEHALQKPARWQDKKSLPLSKQALLSL